MNKKRGKDQHVFKHLNGWAVKGEGNEKVTRIFKTHKQAILFAEDIAKAEKSCVKNHGRDGRIIEVKSKNVKS